MTYLEPGTFIVANYETAQPLELAHEVTPYCWIVETSHIPASDRNAARIQADFAGYVLAPRHSQANHGMREVYLEHLDAAFTFMRTYVLPSGSDARLVYKASTQSGMMFVFS